MGRSRGHRLPGELETDLGRIAAGPTERDRVAVGIAADIAAGKHVRLHGGRVWVEARRDGEPGARFVVELPCEIRN
ncbi:MAG: hypothetical protein EBX51_07980 [Acidimicrobiia bacterium]|nr:hypothetical protein [Acidimicrobiia bacterium]